MIKRGAIMTVFSGQNYSFMMRFLKKLHDNGFTLSRIEFPDYYFWDENESDYEIMHFTVSEYPYMQFGIWYRPQHYPIYDKDGNFVDYSEYPDKQFPQFFADFTFWLDKFKPQGVAYSPMYDLPVEECTEELVLQQINVMTQNIHKPWLYDVAMTEEDYLEHVAEYDDKIFQALIGKKGY